MLQRPFDMYDEGAPDQYILGFMNQVSQAVDDGVTKEVEFFIKIDTIITNFHTSIPWKNRFPSDLAFTFFSND